MTKLIYINFVFFSCIDNCISTNEVVTAIRHQAIKYSCWQNKHMSHNMYNTMATTPFVAAAAAVGNNMTT